jgi:nucleoside-diphosphate-sugar epimerase
VILVTGGAGVLGSRLVLGLRARGEKVRVVTLPGDPGAARLAEAGCEIAFADVSDAASLAGAFDGVETVFHLAAVIIAGDPEVYRRVNVGGVRHAVDGARAAGARHFVYVSSAAALHPDGSAYARSKADGEAIVRAARGMRHTIVRPTLIYDHGGGQEIMLFLAALRRFPVVPFVGRGRALKRPIFADDVVKGLVAIAGNEAAFDKTYAFSGGEAIAIWELGKLLLAAHGERRPFVPIPVPLCRLAAAVLERAVKDPPLTRYGISRIVEDAALDNSAARADLGFEPVGVREGLARCYGKSSQTPLLRRGDLR